MAILRTDKNQIFQNGQLVSEQTVNVDVTADAVTYDLHTRIRQAYLANRTFLAIETPTNAQLSAQLKSLTKQMQGVIRLVVAQDLLNEDVVD